MCVVPGPHGTLSVGASHHFVEPQVQGDVCKYCYSVCYFGSNTSTVQSNLGISIGNLILPLIISQCEHFLLFYNTTGQPTSSGVSFLTSDSHEFLSLNIPSSSIGFIDWVCNIPVDDSFAVLTPGNATITYTVLPGTSACLDVIWAVPASWGTFDADVFTSYTAHPFDFPVTGAK